MRHGQGTYTFSETGAQVGMGIRLYVVTSLMNKYLVNALPYMEFLPLTILYKF